MHVDDAGHPSVVPMAVRTTAPAGTTFVDPGGCIDPFDGLIALLTDPAGSTPRHRPPEHRSLKRCGFCADDSSVVFDGRAPGTGAW
jgi:hypothetical protein